MTYYNLHTPLPAFIPYARFLLNFPLSETARLIYSLILFRMNLSQSNKWIDGENRVYCRYTIQDLIADTGKSKTTVLTALSDLEAQGLLVRHRCGSGYANRLYLRLPDSCTSEYQKTGPERYGKLTPNKNKNKILNYEYKGDSL